MTVPRARRSLDAIPAYAPGKAAIDDLHKLSSNENPFDPLPGVTDAAVAELRRMNRYPDAAATALVEAIARRRAVRTDQIVVGTGSVSVLFQLLQAHAEPGDEVVFAWRSFEAYPIAARLTGATAVPVALRPDATHDLDAMAAAVTPRTKVALICTPNNPTGPVVSQADLAAFLDAVGEGVVVVVDEAYAEYVRDPRAAEAVALLADRPQVVSLRTFSKAYGLAGLRVGYAVAAPPLAASIRKAIPPFSVSDVAQAAAVASIASIPALAERVDRVVAERDAMVAALRERGFAVPSTEANFCWLPLGDEAADFAAACDPVSVRPFPGDGVRVTIGAPEVNAEFLAAVDRWLARRA